jgi:lipid A 3-O-deacylase
MRPLFLLLAPLLTWAACATTAPADPLRPLSPTRLLSYTYANDLFFRTDYYFTQGMSLTLVHPALARLPTQRLLPRGPAGGTQHHGITLRYDGFTPLRIQDPFIRVGDRPYAAYLVASFFRVSTHPTRHLRLTTAWEIGFIGPAAGGKELQTAIHRLTGNAEPRGWDYQIRNAPLLGYRVEVEKQLAARRHVELIGQAQASLSALYTYAGTGVRLRVGRLHPYFANLGTASPDSQTTPPLHWQLYGQATLEGRLIGYDTTLQGSLLPSHDPYTLASSTLQRGVLRSSGGVVLAHEGLSFAASATWTSPEFAGARSHRWGELGVKVAF